MSNDISARPIHGGNLAWAASLAGCSPRQLLDFSASVSPLGPPIAAIAAIESHLDSLTAYPDPTYCVLRESLGRHHGLSPDWILPGNGSAELLTWASRDFSRLQGVLMPTPAFGDYGRALSAFSVPVIAAPLDLGPMPTSEPDANAQVVNSQVINSQATNPQHSGFAGGFAGHDSLGQSLERAIADHALSPQEWGLLINNPHNPTGWKFLATTLRSYLPRFGLVVIDEAFMDFLPLAQQSSLIAQIQRFPNLVILRSLTKFYSLPGLRLGYAIAHPNRLKQWQSWRDPWPVNSLAVAAAIAVLQDNDFQQASWQWLAEARPQLQQAIDAIPALQSLPGAAANYLLVQCDCSVPKLQHDLLKHHRILIRDCLSFPELGDRYFRVAVRTLADNTQLVTALKTSLAKLS